jgi:hypothetical protein
LHGLIPLFILAALARLGFTLARLGFTPALCGDYLLVYQTFPTITTILEKAL